MSIGMKFTGAGYLGDNPTIKYFESGAAIVNLSFGITKRVKKNDQWIDEKHWIDVECWKDKFNSEKQSMAEVIVNSLKKGDFIAINSADFRINTFLDKNNQPKSKIVVELKDWNQWQSITPLKKDKQEYQPQSTQPPQSSAVQPETVQSTKQSTEVDLASVPF